MYNDLFSYLYQTGNNYEYNIIKDGDDYIFEIPIPGVDKEDIDVSVDESIIKISINDKKDREYIFTGFRLPRVISINYNNKKYKIKNKSARYENGMLYITVTPKTDKNKLRLEVK